MYSCKILADSIGVNGGRLTTFEVSFPRIVLSEFNTHRMFSRNSSSSRAIPSSKIIARVINDPFIPFYWGKNQNGMSAFSTLNIEDSELAKAEWIDARDYMVKKVNNLLSLNVHKQIANRLLEPFMWQTVIISATGFDNFFALRIDENAQPEIRKIAEDMKYALDASSPVLLKFGDWHLPLLDDIIELKNKYSNLELRKISAGRCCRVSYLTHNGIRDPNEDIKLCENLINNGHMSPLEHQAEYIGDKEYYGNFFNFKQFRKNIINERIFQK